MGAYVTHWDQRWAYWHSDWDIDDEFGEVTHEPHLGLSQTAAAEYLSARTHRRAAAIADRKASDAHRRELRRWWQEEWKIYGD